MFWETSIYFVTKSWHKNDFSISGDYPGRAPSVTTLSASSMVSSHPETESKRKTSTPFFISGLHLNVANNIVVLITYRCSMPTSGHFFFFVLLVKKDFKNMSKRFLADFFVAVISKNISSCWHSPKKNIQKLWHQNWCSFRVCWNRPQRSNGRPDGGWPASHIPIDVTPQHQLGYGCHNEGFAKAGIGSRSPRPVMAENQNRKRFHRFGSSWLALRQCWWVWGNQIF